MLVQFAPWLLIAAIGQTPTETALLKAAPADVDVAVRCRGVEAVQQDIVAAIKAMDAEWGNMAEGLLSGQVAEIGQKHGDRAVKSPLLVLVRLPEPGGEGGPPSFAVLLPSDDYEGTLKALTGGKAVDLKHQDGDFDALDGPEGQGTWYAAKSPGIVALGSSKDIIAAIAKRPAKTLDAVLTGPAAKGFLGGDAGLYVNYAAIMKRYADQIEQGRQAIEGFMDQLDQRPGQAASAKVVREMYSGLFDWFKQVDGLTYHLDFAEKGVHLAGFVKVRPGSDAEKAIAGTETTEVASLGHLPPGAAFYLSMNVGARTFQKLQALNLTMIEAAGKPSPELEKAMADLHGMGRFEVIGSVAMDRGLISINAIRTPDPKGYIEKCLALLRAMSTGEGRSGIYKDVKIETDAEKVGGISFTHARATVDVEKMAGLAGNVPGQVEAMKAILGDGRMNFWYGVDGDRLLQVGAPSWEAARPLIETTLKREGGIGKAPGFRAVASELPDRSSASVLVGAQEVIRLVARQLDAAGKKVDLKILDDMPKEPAYAGAAILPRPSEGYEFHLVVPSEVGPPIARGLIPILQSAGD